MVEVSSSECDVQTLVPAVEAPPVVGYHTNKYESNRFKGIDGPSAWHPSSVHRMARMAELPLAASTDALKAVVSDTHDPVYPIHRTPRAKDPFETLNSVLFDVAAKTISVWGMTAPTTAKQPQLRIDWRSMDYLAA